MITPLHLSSTFAQDGVGIPRAGYEYARSQNPTRERLERAIATLEGGAYGIAFASGSAATAAIAELAGPGDEIVVGDDVYGGTFRYLERVRRAADVVTRRPLRGPSLRHPSPTSGRSRSVSASVQPGGCATCAQAST